MNENEIRKIVHPMNGELIHLWKSFKIKPYILWYRSIDKTGQDKWGFYFAITEDSELFIHGSVEWDGSKYSFPLIKNVSSHRQQLYEVFRKINDLEQEYCWVNGDV